MTMLFIKRETHQAISISIHKSDLCLTHWVSDTSLFEIIG